MIHHLTPRHHQIQIRFPLTLAELLCSACIVRVLDNPILTLVSQIAKSAVSFPRPIPALPPSQATALARPTRQATANAATLRFGLARGSLRARFPGRAAASTSRPREETMIEVYGTTFARITEIKRGMLVRRLAAFHIVVDVRVIEDDAARLWLDDGSTISLGSRGLVEVAR